MKEKVEDWIAEWLDLFPKASITGSQTYLKGTVKDVVKKMQNLVKEDKRYTKDVIFAATKMYLDERKRDNYRYIKRPTYFIHKQDQGSMLAGVCERIIENDIPAELKNYPVSENDMFI